MVNKSNVGQNSILRNVGLSALIVGLVVAIVTHTKDLHLPELFLASAIFIVLGMVLIAGSVIATAWERHQAIKREFAAKQARVVEDIRKGANLSKGNRK